MRTRLVVLLLPLLLASVAAQSDSAAGDWDSELDFEPFCVGTEQCKRFSDGTVRLQAEENKMGAFKSRGHYLYGVFTARMKLPADYSGGLVTCFYLTSNATADYREDHDEIDFEFFGGRTPREILINTNLLSHGQQFNEQYSFPFDPSTAYHDYSLIWGPTMVAWAIDGRPVRVTKRLPGKPWVGRFPMRAFGSIWDSSSWSALKSNYSTGPVSVHYRSFDIRACQAQGPRPADAADCRSIGRESGRPWQVKFGRRQTQKMESFRKSHVTLSIPWVPIPPPYIPPEERANGSSAAAGSEEQATGSLADSSSSGDGTAGRSDDTAGVLTTGREAGAGSPSGSAAEGQEGASSGGAEENNNIDAVSGSSIRSIGGTVYRIDRNGGMQPLDGRR